MSYTWTWNQSSLNGSNGLCFAGDDASAHMIVGTNNKIWYSSNLGVSWTQTNTSFISNNVIAVASTGDGSMMFAVVGNPGGFGNAIYNSVDYGVTWNAISTDPPSTNNITSICCNGIASGTVYFFVTTGAANSGTGSIYQTAFTSGTIGSWYTGSGTATGYDFRGIACTSTGSAYLAVVYSGSIFQTGAVSSPPNTWTSTGTSAKSWSSIACSGDNTTFIACSSDTNGLIYTGTYSGTWNFTLKYTAIGISLYYAAIGTTGTKLYATYTGGYLYSLDSGSTWTNDTSKTGVFSLRARRPSIVDTTSGLPLVLGVNSGTNARGVYYATYSLTPICFKEGSKILCFVDGKEMYLPIETLKPGTFVKTYLHGYKAIDMIGSSKIYNPAHTLRGKNRLYVCKKEKYPEITEDLVITGCHSILVDSVTEQQYKDIEEFAGRIYVTDKLCRFPACLDDRAEPYTEEGVHTIWHFALTHNDYYMNYGVYANGLLVETTSKRMMKDLSGMELV